MLKWTHEVSRAVEQRRAWVCRVTTRLHAARMPRSRHVSTGMVAVTSGGNAMMKSRTRMARPWRRHWPIATLAVPLSTTLRLPQGSRYAMRQALRRRREASSSVHELRVGRPVFTAGRRRRTAIARRTNACRRHRFALLIIRASPCQKGTITSFAALVGMVMPADAYGQTTGIDGHNHPPRRARLPIAQAHALLEVVDNRVSL